MSKFLDSNGLQYFWQKIKNAIRQCLITDTASGAIASFSDGAAMPMESLTVDLEPIQDLHGYDSPWLAGGGKNKFDQDTIYASFKQSDGSFLGVMNPSITAIHTNIPIAMVGQQVTFSAMMKVPSGSTIGNLRVCVNIGGVVRNGSLVNSSDYSLSYITFTPSSADDYVYFSFGSNGAQQVQFKDVMLALGTDTAFAPYSNICPISGRDSVTVTRTGKNIFGGITMGQAIVDAVNNRFYSNFGEDESGNYVTIKASSVVSDKPFTKGVKFKENTQYTLVLKITRNQAAPSLNANIKVEYTDGTQTGVTIAASTTAEIVTKVVVTPASKSVKQVTTVWGGGTAKLYYEESGIFEGVLTAADFIPYDAQSATIQLGQTVYGGTVDVTTGVMTVDRAALTLTDAYTYIYGTASTGLPYIGFSNTQIPAYDVKFDAIPICDRYKPSRNASIDFAIRTAMHSTYIYDSRFTSLQTAKEIVNGTQLVFELATPLTIQLTPAQLTTLHGQNNVWSDADSVDVTYIADPKLYIARLTEPDADMVADAKITSGSYFMVGNNLYLATANIASGATIVPGVNCTKTNLSSALNAHNAINYTNADNTLYGGS